MSNRKDRSVTDCSRTLSVVGRSCCNGTIIAALVCLAVGLPGCKRQKSTSQNQPLRPNPNVAGPPQLPARALSIPAPKPPSAVLNGKNLKTASPGFLRQMAYRHMDAEQYQKAAHYQYWCVQTTDDGCYDLACWECLAGNVDAALYWLQEAGQRNGVNSFWAQRDSDLRRARADSRWPKLLNHLRKCEFYWRAYGPKETTIVVPDGYDGKTELPIVVWLHSMGGRPTDFETVFHKLANGYKIAFIGVSGTIPTGKTAFAWADVAEDDYARIRESLAKARKRIRWKKGTAVALGFSQGAMVGVEVAVRHPEEFAGAITVSAGSASPLQLDKVADRTGLSRQGFVVVCGAKEEFWSVARSNELARWLKAGSATVLKPSYPNHSTHSFPAGFWEKFPDYFAFVRRVGNKTNGGFQ